MTLELQLDVLGKFGVEAVEPHGEPFDPQYHEAMAMVPNPDLEPNSVMEVMQKGYLLNGRLVRPAMVVVSQAAS
jgi:molecular chaperone GrpE